MADQGKGVYMYEGTDYENIGPAVGTKGERGEIGPRGLPGADGSVGPVGPQGIPGPAGERGLQGAAGADGQDGVDGVDGITPAISVTATVDDGVGVPSVDIITGGTLEAPSFQLNFHNLKGAAGSTGAAGSPGERGLTGESGTNGTDGTDGTDGVRGSQIWRYNNMHMSEADARTELFTNHQVQDQYIRDIDGTMATGVLAGDWVINMRLKSLVRLTGRKNSYMWATTDDDVIGLPAGAQGPTGQMKVWRVHDYQSGYSPAMQENPPEQWVQDCFWFRRYEGPSPSDTPTAGEFFYTTDSNSLTTLGCISGIGDDFGTTRPYSLFSDCNQIRAAQGIAGASIYHTRADFTIDNDHRDFALDTSPRTPQVGDMVYDTTNTYKANIASVGVTTYRVENVVIAAERGLQGLQGIPGPSGRDGATGPAGYSQKIERMTATIDNHVGTPTVNVVDITPTGSRDKQYRLDFRNLRGQDGDKKLFWTTNISLASASTIVRSNLYNGMSTGYASRGDIVFSPDNYIAFLGEENNNVFTLTNKYCFKGNKGDKGDTGDRGPKGDKGDPGRLDADLYYTKSEIDTLISDYAGGGREVIWQGKKCLDFKMFQEDTTGFAAGDVREAPRLTKYAPGYAGKKVLVTVCGFVVNGTSNVYEKLEDTTYYNQRGRNWIYGKLNKEHTMTYHDGISLQSYITTLEELENNSNNVYMYLDIPATCMLADYDTTMDYPHRKYATANIYVAYCVTLI